MSEEVGIDGSDGNNSDMVFIEIQLLLELLEQVPQGLDVVNLSLLTLDIRVRRDHNASHQLASILLLLD